MNQAEIGKLVSALRFKVRPDKIKTFSGGDGNRGRLMVYRNTVTALINNERLEMKKAKGWMVREYTERLISEAGLY